MRRFLTSLMPARIGGQIAVLVVTALALAHIVMTAGFFLLEPHPPRPGEGIAAIERLAFLARMLNAENDTVVRATLLASAQRVDPELSILPSVPPAVTEEPFSRLLHETEARLGEGTELRLARQSPTDAQQPRLMAVAKLSDSSALALPLALPPMRLISPFAIGTLVFLASAVTILSLWAARQLTAPLAKFADAAERFTADASTAPLTEDGPIEVRRAAKALNDMQQRVLKLIADRTRMLAAVSHDLRTPITRLRLRAEDIENEELRFQILGDLATMQKLVQSALSFLHGQVEPGPKIKTDLPALVQTVCDNFLDTGGAVSCTGRAHLYVTCEPDQMMRAIENLIDNGLKFGKSVAVHVERQGGAAIIDIQDDGPGISDMEKSRVTEAFYRGDSARNLNAGDSFGLGLSIAQAIIERSEGTLAFLDGVPRGLVVRISLPVADQGASEPRRSENATWEQAR